MKNCRAFTLVEILVTLVIVAILMTGAVVGFSNILLQQRLEGAANRIYTDLRLAQSEAIKRNKTVYVSFSTGVNQWCYGISVDSNCDCTNANSCKVDEVETIVSSENYDGIILQSARFAGGTDYTAFDPRKGFAQAGSVKNGTVWLSNERQQVAVVLNRVGRVRFCSPDINKYSNQCPNSPN